MDDFILSLFIASLTANVIMLKVVFDHIKHARELTVEIHSLEAEIWSLKSRKYKKVVRFLNPGAMPQNRLEEEIALYQEDGWTFDKDMSVNGLLAFYKTEEEK